MVGELRKKAALFYFKKLDGKLDDWISGEAPDRVDPDIVDLAEEFERVYAAGFRAGGVHTTEIMWAVLTAADFFEAAALLKIPPIDLYGQVKSRGLLPAVHALLDATASGEIQRMTRMS